MYLATTQISFYGEQEGIYSKGNEQVCRKEVKVFLVLINTLPKWTKAYCTQSATWAAVIEEI